MMCRRRSLRVLGLVAAFVCSTGAIIAGPGDKNDNQGQTKDQTDLRKKYLRPIDPALYVGAETCQACHEDIYKNLKQPSILPRRTSACCLGCHQYTEEHGITSVLRICLTAWDVSIASLRITPKRASSYSGPSPPAF